MNQDHDCKKETDGTCDCMKEEKGEIVELYILNEKEE